jgi:UDP-3-O-[3-hydroxymyristoyl] glucosamine N-acyltransferase
MRNRIDPTPLASIVSLLGKDVLDVAGSTERIITRLDSLDEAGPGALTFARKPEFTSNAEAVIAPAGCAVQGPALIRVENPRLAFIRVAAHFFGRQTKPGIHPTSVIDPSAKIDPTAEIGPHVVIGPRCSVGAHTTLGAKVVLHQDVQIGQRTKIDPGCVIGGEGFGFERQADGTLLNFPHIGGVRIGNDVDIGGNVCVDRGTLDDTVIEDGARIDNLSHISHNVRIGKNAVVICLVTICGSSVVDDGAWVAPNASVLNQRSVGKGAVVGMGSVVIHDVPEGAVVAGNPAQLKPRKPVKH